MVTQVSSDEKVSDDEIVELFKGNDYYLTYEQYEAERVAAPKETKPREPSYKALRSKFLFASNDVIKRTFHATTQFIKHLTHTGTNIRMTYKSPCPAANVLRRNEPVATDMIYGDTPAVDCGFEKAQVFVGRKSLVLDVFGIKSDKWFVTTLWDVIRKRGAMSMLTSDAARVEISKKVKDVLRQLFIKDWHSEPGFQHQNYGERRYQSLKHNSQNLMNRMRLPAYAWFHVVLFVAFCMNHMAVESLEWRTPLEVLTGQTPDISPLLQYEFHEDVYFTDYRASNAVTAETEIAGWFYGIAENVGHSMTYKVLSKEDMTIYHRSCLRRASDGRNARADDRARIALGLRGLGMNGLPLPTRPDGTRHGPSMDDTPVADFTFADSTREAFDPLAPMATFDPSDLLGRTFLPAQTTLDAPNPRRKIVEVLHANDQERLHHPEVLKLRCQYRLGENVYDEIVSYNEICQLLEDDPQKEGKWFFEEILDHKKVSKRDKDYMGCEWNVKIR